MVRKRIETGSLQPGERLPSVRAMSLQTGYSIETVCRAYADLEAEGMIRSRPRSGFYVKRSTRQPREFADTTYEFPRNSPVDGEVYAQAYTLMAELRRERGVSFASILPSPDLFDTLNRELSIDVRRHMLKFGRSTPKLRAQHEIGLEEAVSRSLAQRNINVAKEDVILTGGGLDNVSACLDVLTKPGDAVIIESPSFFPQLEILRNRDLRIVEIYSHPRTGIDPIQFEHLLRTERIKTAILMPVHHYPTGVTYQFLTFQRIVEIAGRYDVPIIENDMFSGFSYRAAPAPSLKSHDRHGNVLLCGTVASHVGPGWDIGWIVSSRFREVLSNRQFFNELDRRNSPAHQAVAEFMLRPRCRRCMNQVSETLAQRVDYGMKRIEKFFPPMCAVSRPTGGFMCWIRGPMSYDAVNASRLLYGQGIQFLAGPMFAMTPSFKNFIGLNLSFPWDSEREEALAKIGKSLGA
jgi:DNA-binding transcriptional MocR family regulator